MKRKIIAIFLIGIMCLSLSGCEKTPIEEVPTTTSTPKVVAYSPAARGFDSLEEFKGALASMQSAAKSQNQAFGLDEIWVPVNLPENAVLYGIGLNEYSYIINFKLNEEEDITKGQAWIVVDYGRYNADGSKAEFDSEDLQLMAINRSLVKMDGYDVYFMNYKDEEKKDAGKMFFYSYKNTRVKLYLPLTILEEMKEANLNPFELSVF